MIRARLLPLTALLASTTALATGERVQLVPSSNPFKATLCVSLDCDAGNPEATVSTRPVRDGLEVTVTTASGQRRLTEVVATKPDGTVTSTELVRATADVLKAIEQGPVKADQAEAKAGPSSKSPKAKGAVAHKPGKKAKAKLWAHL
jgi:hypothetical protein